MGLSRIEPDYEAGSQAVRAFLRNAADAQRRAVLVTPTPADEFEVSSTLGAEHPMGLRVRTLERLVAEAWLKRGDGREIVSSSQRYLLMESVCERVGAPGLSRFGARLVQDLADGGSDWREMPILSGAEERIAAPIRAYAELTRKHSLIEMGEIVSGTTAVYQDLADCDVFVYGQAASDRRLEACLSRCASAGARVVAESLPTRRDRRLSHDVTFLEVPGDAGEADVVAREVVKALADGVQEREIAIVSCGASLRGRHIARKLDDAGVRSPAEVLVRMRASAFGRSLAGVAEFSLADSRAGLLTALRSGHIVGSETGAARLEARWRRRAIEAPEALLESIRAIDEAAAAVLGEVRGISGDTMPESAAERWDRLIGLMLHRRFGRPGRPTEALEPQLRAAETVRRLLRDSARFNLAMTPRLMLGTVHGSMLAQGIPGWHDGVTLATADRLPNRRFDVIIILGLEEGEFPRGDDGLGDSRVVRKLFEAAGIEPPSGRLVEGERALLDSLVERARERLVCVRRHVDAEGAPVAPSLFWEELRATYQATGGFTSDTGSRPSGSLAMRSGRAHEASACGQGRQGLLEDHAAREYLAERSVFSAGELEVYAGCPYRWFVERAVGGAALDWEADALNRGTAVHRALAATYEALREHGVVRVEKETDPALLARAVDTGVGAALARVPDSRRDVVEGWVRPRVARSLRADATFAPGYVPTLFEWSFGAEEPLELVPGIGLRGAVDRVDISRAGESSIVIDYKSSRVHTYRQLTENDVLQVPLYAYAVERLLGLRVEAGVYRSLSDATTRGFALGPEHAIRLPDNDRVTEEQRCALIEGAVERAVGAARGIRAGRVAPVPGASCEWCSARGSCEEAPR